MLNHFVITLSALFFICILSPLLMVYAFFIIIRVGAVDPLMRVYALFHDEMQHDPFEPV